MIPNEASMKFIPVSCLVSLVPQRLKASAVSCVSEKLTWAWPLLLKPEGDCVLQGSLPLVPALVAVGRCYLQTLQLSSFALDAAASLGKGVSGNGLAELSSCYKVIWQGCAPQGEPLGACECDQMKCAQFDLERKQCCKAQVIPAMGSVYHVRKKYGLWV